MKTIVHSYKQYLIVNMTMQFGLNAIRLQMNVRLTGMRLKRHTTHQCRLSFTQRRYPEKIYGAFHNHVERLPRIYCNDRQSETYSVFKHRDELTAPNRHHIQISKVTQYHN